MSSHYNLEPQPTASVIIHTTQGELSVELFAKQTPLTCRNFLQLALDGYYDNTIFHRLVPGFILQGGDPTGTGNGGESIYDGGAFSGDLDPWPMDQRQGKNAGPTGVGMKDEFHSRLRFNRRGLLGMANEGSVNTNGSQFFFTLDKAEELTQKNTLFGRVAGDTIYNLAKMGEAEVNEGTDRPTYPVKITRVEILINPFEDMRKRERVAKREEAQQSSTSHKKKAKKSKAGKKLLSFADEDDEEEEELVMPKKPKYDPRIVMDVDEDEPKPRTNAKVLSITQKPANTKGASLEPRRLRSPSPVPAPAQRRKEQSLSKEMEDDSDDIPLSPKRPEKKSRLEQTNAEFAALKASMRRDVRTEAPKQEDARKQSNILDEFAPENAIRGRKRKHGTSQASEAKTLADLTRWKSMLEKAPARKPVDHSSIKLEDSGATPPTAGDEEAELCDLHFIANCMSCRAWDKEDKEESDDEGWMSNALKAAPDMLGKDLNDRRKAEDELVVIDPREKHKSLKEEKRAARESRSGGTGREWDQARNAKLARQAALAGRGAR